MLEIEYKGGTSVLIATKEYQLLTDPNVELFGLKIQKQKNVAYLATETRFRVPVTEEIAQLEGPGEYEVGPFAIQGIAAQRHIDTEDVAKLTTIFHIDVLDYRIGFLGNVDAKLSEEQLELLGVIDILIIPVGGGGYTLDAKSAAKIVNQTEPKIIIPIQYDDAPLKYEVPQDSVELFLAEFPALPHSREAKLKFKSIASIPQTPTIVVLERT